jgi:SAM-dependent methyltransferase
MELTQYDDVDPVGEETLEAISGADNFNKWIYDTVAPYIKGDLLEIGSGIGNISQYFAKNDIPVMLTDLRTNYCDILRKRFASYPGLIGVRKIDLVQQDFELRYADVLNRFDSIIASNVVEHIEDHEVALRNCLRLLRPGGHVIIIVPAFQFLYNKFDEGLGHYRRYTKKRLNGLIASQGFQIIHSQYFNGVGIAGWWVSGKLLKKKVIPGSQMSIFDKLILPIKAFDKITFNQFGLSVISVGKKPV